MNRCFFHCRRRMHLVVMVGVYLGVTMLIQQESRSEQLNSLKPTTATAKSVQPTAGAATTGGGETGHDGRAESLEYVLDYARDAYDWINREVVDYTCFMVNRERVDGKLSGYRGLFAKVRHARKNGDGTVVPFGVYLRFLKPASAEGREVLYVPAVYRGDLWARRGGRNSPNTTLRLQPDSPMAMLGNRYPITEIGFQTLTRRLIELLELEQKHNDAVVEVFPNAKVDGRPSTFFRLTYEQDRSGTLFRMAEIAFDTELNIPVYFRSVDWPTATDAKPVLEEYYYKRLQLNVGLTDQDFDVHNPEYQFDLTRLGATLTDDEAVKRSP